MAQNEQQVSIGKWLQVEQKNLFLKNEMNFLFNLNYILSICLEWLFDFSSPFCVVIFFYWKYKSCKIKNKTHNND